MNFLAYTIGPIYETILSSLNDNNKTKRLQSSSAYFSEFMRVLLKNIGDDFDILVPYIGAEALTKRSKMGLFHDRFIASSQKSKDAILSIFHQKLEKTFIDIAKDTQNGVLATGLFHNMDNHLIIATKEELSSVDENIVFALNKILDSKELQRDFTFDIEKNHIKLYEEKHIKSSKVKTIEDMSDKLGFKYYAVITADGDKMGDKIQKEATKDVTNIKQISEKLYRFFTQESDVYETTNTLFGGELIYAGGDDILALLPVKNGDKTFLDYVETLDKRFKEIVGSDVSLSFGINIAYYKYPLRDAIKSSFDLLHEVKVGSLSNSLSMKITKHSGQWFDTNMTLNSEVYKKYKELVDGVLKNTLSLPHSLHHSLKRYEEAILATYRDERTIDAMFKTVFNDEKSQSDSKGLELIKEYLNLYKPKTNREFDDIFSALSLLKFLREDRA